MFNLLGESLKEIIFSIKDCRGNFYDNASPVSWKYNGVQASLAKENIWAILTPGIGHYSLQFTEENA